MIVAPHVFVAAWLASAPASEDPLGPEPAPVRSEESIAKESSVDLNAPRKKQRFVRPGSPQRFGMEFGLGPYLPDVDKNYHGSGFGPYATIFGRTDDNGVTTKKPLPGVMPRLAFEWQFAYLAGTFGLATEVGYYRDKAKAILAMPTTAQTRSNADNTVFGMVPISLLISYRFSMLADRYRVPLVPYAKAGLTYAFYWIKDGTEKIAKNTQGEKGHGGVLGWQLDFGLMLRLDGFERSTSKKLDNNTGINHTYLFGEYQLSRINNFGVGRTIQLGDSTFFAGLAVEF